MIETIEDLINEAKKYDKETFLKMIYKAEEKPNIFRFNCPGSYLLQEIDEKECIKEKKNCYECWNKAINNSPIEFKFLQEDCSEDMIYRKAIDNFGEVTQCIKAMEELSELIQAISRVILEQGDETKNKSNFNEEIADVEIMIKQLKLTKNYEDNLFNYWKDYKLKRLKDNVW